MEKEQTRLNRLNGENSMKNEMDHGALTVAQSGFGAIQRCRCEGYHLALRNINLHFTQEEFVALADLFKRAEEREEENLPDSLCE